MPLRGKRILIVEQHEDTREAMAEALRQMGSYDTRAINIPTDLDQFVALVHDYMPDLIVWDIPCPYKEHCGLFAEMYASNGMKRFCFIGTTTTRPSTIFEMLGDKLYACLTKPFDWNDMLKSVATVMLLVSIK